ncbi:MAG: amidase, partial [Burkholderiaceae bacterium]
MTELSALEAARRMARGDLRVADYAQALLARAEASAPFNALIHLDRDGLLADAAALDAAPLPDAGTRPLYGVP